MREEDDVDDLLPLYTAAWGKEWEITGDCQRFVPAWKKAFAQIEKRGGGSVRGGLAAEPPDVVHVRLG